MKRTVPFWVSCLLLAAAGCSTAHYRKSADREAARVIAEKTPQVPNMETNFTIEKNPLVLQENLPVLTNSDASLGPAGEAERGARIISLEKALEIAVKNSRTYQNRKEILYLEALDLTLARYRFTPIFSTGVRTDYRGSRNVERDVKTGVDKLVEEHRWTGNSGVGMDMLLRSGARIATDFTMDFTRFLSGNPGWATSSRLAGTLTQPLWRGAGYKTVMENLTQAERDLLYALREFTRFRKDYTVQIVSAYYGVLQNRDSVRTAWLNYQAFKKSAERERAFAQEGQRKLSEVGRLEQEELNGETGWINAINAYKQGLDQFKIQLGLPTDNPLVLENRELAKLAIVHPDVGVEEAIRIALATRLDLYNVRNQYEDAARKVDLAKNGLKPDLDLVLSGSVNSKPGSGLPELDFNRTDWNAGLGINLPLDRKAERNTYRTSLINYDRALRSLELAVDNIKLDVYNDLRKLDQAKRNYETSVLGVDLNRRRVEEQDMLAELGRGTAEAKVAAQNSLTSSMNQRTGALVNHTIARLSLWRDLGILDIKENGQWEEIFNVKNQ
ncbi:MAG: TolC family protein [Verrucomicrobiota bacterium]